MGGDDRGRHGDRRQATAASLATTAKGCRLMGALSELLKRPHTPATAATVATERPATAEVSQVSQVSQAPIADIRFRLKYAGQLADCPASVLDRLHPDEAAEYAHYGDAEMVESLRHLATCRTCRDRQTRRVTCATCARYLPDVLNPTAGMGQCADGLCAGPMPPYPHIPRHCQGWRAAA